jgi:hypothetical protein
MRKVLADFATDLHYGLRQIRKNLSLTIVCAAVLAIGIGSATAVFAVLYDAVLKPLPYREAAQLVYVHNQFPGSQLAQTAASGPDYVDLTTHLEIFSETAAYYFNDFTMTGAGEAQHVDAVNASATVAVGTPVAQRSPRGSVRALISAHGSYHRYLASKRTRGCG